MATTKVSILIKESIPGTADLQPPDLEASYTFEVDGDEEHERIKMAYIKKNFESTMRQKFKEQIKGFALPLASMQKDIDKLKAIFNALTTETNPLKLAEQIHKAKDQKDAIDTQIQEYGKYLKDAVANIEKQQLLIWAQKVEEEAEKEAKKKIKSDIRWKKARHVAGAVIKGTLVLGAAAAAIAVTIVTFGAAAPVFAAMAVAFASLGGATALYKTGSDIKGKYNLEKRALANLEEDLKTIQTHLGAIANKTTGLPKHLDDASRLCTERQSLIKSSAELLANLDVQAKEIRSSLSSLKGVGDLKFIKSKEAALQKIEKEQAKAQKTISDAQVRDAEFSAFLDKARVTLGELNKIPVVGSRGVLDSLQRYKNVDSLVNGLDAVSSIGGAAAGLG